YQQHNTHPRTF
nr:immunoglobulin light chain junction region [Macaca mulatta]